MPAADGRLEEVRGRPALRFERALRHPPERVWSALTEVDEQFAWHPTPARFEPRIGGAVEWDPEGYVEDMASGEVTDYDPPRLLGYTWAVDRTREPDHLRWELRPHDDGCLLVLVHSFGDRLRAPSYGAGWHLCLESLAGWLERGARDGAPASGSARWQELNARYQRRFGISPGQATRPPSRGS
jgi:uncharacterized protein YndB with AHSA1/START domain